VRLRILHGDWIFRRFDSVPHQPEHCGRVGTKGKIAVFFVDDNFAINVKRTKSLLRDIIAAGVGLNWVAQISANVLKDEELLDLIAESGGNGIFIGMESLDPANLASVKKSFNLAGKVWRGAMCTPSPRSSLASITIKSEWANGLWPRCVPGRRFCRYSGKLRRCQRRRFTTAWPKKAG
jgi:hypothetical protein